MKKIIIFRSKPTLHSLLNFSKSLSVLLKAKIPLHKALQILQSQTSDKQMKTIISSLLASIYKGKPFSEALARHTNIFGNLYIEMVRIGETSGKLDEMLMRQTSYLEKAARLRQKISMAMIYPSIIVAISILSVVFLITFIVPTFKELFSDFQAQIPPITLMLLNSKDFLLRFWLFILIAGVIIVYLLRKILAVEIISDYIYRRVLLKVPVIGELVKRNNMAKLSRTMYVLLEAGIPFVEAVRVCKGSFKNRIIRESLEKTVLSLSKGQSFFSSFGEREIFPEFLRNMLKVGEESSYIADIFKHLADFYEEELDSVVDTLSAIVEPIIILLLGIVIGFVIIMLYLPLFEMINNFNL
ncbi:MAG: type II secretion system F family protein [Candidatus Cloacimonetes bacterium]|nr:type II secretion system F family protein [Candidatus Cloacimonadota bacterium]